MDGLPHRHWGGPRLAGVVCGDVCELCLTTFILPHAEIMLLNDRGMSAVLEVLLLMCVKGLMSAVLCVCAEAAVSFQKSSGPLFSKL